VRENPGGDLIEGEFDKMLAGEGEIPSDGAEAGGDGLRQDEEAEADEPDDDGGELLSWSVAHGSRGMVGRHWRSQWHTA
jgi:hypothetical protein